MNLSLKQYAGTLAACAALFCAAGTAQASYGHQPSGPQFSGKVTSAIDPKTGDVKICFKETGLKKDKQVDYLAKGTATASYACLNPGGNCPKGQYTSIKENVTAKASYSPDKYGTVSACITLKVPKAKQNPCPGPMKLLLQSVSWKDLSITDTTNKVGPVAAYPSKQSVNYGACPAPAPTPRY
ncbi:hypothetical protein F2P45_01665 [Massilia sp. CCM 8733]|uniref:Uncharacterized protein n=1 Tax=Massilia mucilaginosa TaxID=2609282 RepID=A0ABX0NLQ7_9BURK|nr:hypothetical protein [Massilia mucilaginosa]NHZ87745.1 hypothetical protein [Massilia mucilaginosa]